MYIIYTTQCTQHMHTLSRMIAKLRNTVKVNYSITRRLCQNGIIKYTIYYAPRYYSRADVDFSKSDNEK